jgi:hypothetical protein
VIAAARRPAPAIGQRLVVEPPAAREVARPAAPSHPKERISDDFLGRVLQGGSGDSGSVARAGSGFDPDAIWRKLDELPDRATAQATPRGMMSLGAGR